MEVLRYAGESDESAHKVMDRVRHRLHCLWLCTDAAYCNPPPTSTTAHLTVTRVYPGH